MSDRDLSQGVSVADLPEGAMLAGRLGEDEILLARSGDDVHAVGAHCSHYHAPLVDGALVRGTVRCPWHHACFSIRTGAAVAAPALNPLPRYGTAVWEGMVYVLDREREADARPATSAVS